MRRKLGELVREMEDWQEYQATCLSLGVPVLYPSPLKQKEIAEKTKRKRRTKREMEQHANNTEGKTLTV